MVVTLDFLETSVFEMKKCKIFALKDSKGPISSFTVRDPEAFDHILFLEGRLSDWQCLQKRKQYYLRNKI